MNKKKIILICSVILLIIATLVVIYLKTDFLKTKEQLFWKYFILEKDEIVKVFSNNEIEEYSSNIKKSSYIKEGKISIESENNLMERINLNLVEKGNKKHDYKNISVDLNYKDKKLADSFIIKDDNYYFVKSNLTGSKYIGIENNNLKQLAKLLGIDNVDIIPNEIKDIDYFELFSLREEELNHLSKKYVPICRKYVKNKDYLKNENVKTDDEILTIYELLVSRKQLNDLVVAILDEVYNDEQVLKIISNKVKIIDDKSDYCEIENIRNKIIDIKDYFNKKEVDDEKFLSIIIYKNENVVEKIELVFKNDRKISVESTDDTIIIKQYDVKDKELKIDTVENVLKTVLDSIAEITYTKKIENKNISKVDVKVICDFGIEKLTFNYDYVEQIKNNVDNIIRKNDIEYIEAIKIDIDTLKTTVQKWLKID